MHTELFEPRTGALLSAALIKALSKAMELADTGDIGPEFRDLVQYARELYELMLEQLNAAEPKAPDAILGTAKMIGNRLFELEALTDGKPNPSTLN
jgi:hypothetical protein